jgi:hypothetical protein
VSLVSNKARLATVTRDLSNQWKETRESWQDARAAEFEQKYLQELVAQVDASLEVLEQLDRILNRIRKDCE